MPGYVLPSEAKKLKEDKEEISIEDLVETERAALGTNTTKVTFETFMEWKKKKVGLLRTRILSALLFVFIACVD